MITSPGPTCRFGGPPANNARKMFCRHGHPLLGDNLYVRADGSRQCITCRRESARRSQKEGLPSENALRKLFQGLREGYALRTLTIGVGPAGEDYREKRCISGMRLQNLRRLNPKIDAKIKALIRKNTPTYHKRSARHLRATAAPAILRDNGELSFNLIHTATRDLPPGIRQDVEGEMFLALAEGRLKLADIPARVREFVRAQNHADRNSVFNPWGHLSLDKPLNDDSDATFMDVIREDQRLWA